MNNIIITKPGDVKRSEYKSAFLHICSAAWDLGAAIGADAVERLAHSATATSVQPLLSPDEAARMCAVSHATLRRHNAPHVLIGGQRRYERAELAAWVHTYRAGEPGEVELRSRQAGGAS